MLLTIAEVCRWLQQWAPTAHAEDFDNTGLLLGVPETPLTGILVAHDTTEAVIAEAVEKKCNLVVGYHPIIFSGLKKITGSNYVERAVMKALQNKVGIYALHTALDKQPQGTNKGLADALQLSNCKVLLPDSGIIGKLVTYVPRAHADSVRDALFRAGAGSIGQYDECSFNMEGKGTFRGGEHTNPFVGEKGKRHTEDEIQLGVIFPIHIKNQLLATLFKIHPYEEVAYEIYQTLNLHQDLGMGLIGDLSQPMNAGEFLNYLKSKLQLQFLRHSEMLEKPVSKVAVLAGSGAFAIAEAKRFGADALVTADLKYHHFFEAEGKILLTDVGHYESEQFTKFLIHDFLVKKITNFAPAFSADQVKVTELNTNPINYA